MPNFSSFAPSVWPGLWVWFENRPNILYLEETCRDLLPPTDGRKFPPLFYRSPPNIRCEVDFRTTPMALAKRIAQMSCNLACMLLMAKLEKALRRFLNFILEAEIWAHLEFFDGSNGGSKIDSFWFISRLQE